MSDIHWAALEAFGTVAVLGLIFGVGIYYLMMNAHRRDRRKITGITRRVRPHTNAATQSNGRLDSIP